MILFKRVSESFRRIEGREWVLLFLETVGVVAGILIAFELNEWSASREAAHRQHQLLERLFDESENTVAILRADRNDMKEIVGRETAFATLLVHRNICPPEPMWKAVDTIPMYPPIAVPSTVYQEIMGSGGLSTIPDRSVRQSVSYYHGILDWVQAQNTNFREHLSLAVSASDPRVTYDLDPSADEPETSHYNIRALCSDHSFRNAIAHSVRNHMIVANLRAELTNSAIEMCATIGATLQRNCSPPFGGALAGPDEKTAAEAVRKTNQASAAR